MTDLRGELSRSRDAVPLAFGPAFLEPTIRAE